MITAINTQSLVGVPIYMGVILTLMLVSLASPGCAAMQQPISVNHDDWYSQFHAPREVDWPKQAIVSVQLLGGNSTEHDAPLTFGQVFKQGAIPNGKSITAKLNDTTVPIQVDPKSTWPDGSLRNAVITVNIPQLDAHTSKFLALYLTSDKFKQDYQGHSTPTVTQLLDSGFDATAVLTIKGQAYQVDARQLLLHIKKTHDCRSWARECNIWLSGPLVSEWIIGVPPIDSMGNPNRHLKVFFYIRAYSGTGGAAIGNVRVDTVVENDWTYVPAPQNIEYNAILTVGAHHFQLNNLTNYAQTRWHKVMWWHDRPRVFTRIDWQYLQATKAISNYANVYPTDAFLNKVRQSVAPMERGDQSVHMGETGDQVAIGPLPQWTSVYVISGDPRAFAWMRANDDALGAYQMHFSDKKTGRPLSIVDHPFITLIASSDARRLADSKPQSGWENDMLPSCALGASCKSPFTYDIAHFPSGGYVTYMVTGDYYYLEELQFIASYVELWTNPGYRDYSKGLLSKALPQVRSQAWALRAIADAAFITPDSDPLKSYYSLLINNIITNYNQLYTGGSVDDPLHVIAKFGNTDGKQGVAIAPWQDSFFTWAVGHVAELGFPGAAKLLKWKAEFQINLMTDWIEHPRTGYCWTQASTYELQVKDSANSPMYESLSKVWSINFPNLIGLTCDSAKMVSKLNTGTIKYRIGEMSGYPWSPTGFTANYQIGLAMAAQTDIPHAHLAWEIFEKRTLKPDYRDNPKYDIVPRWVH